MHTAGNNETKLNCPLQYNYHETENSRLKYVTNVFMFVEISNNFFYYVIILLFK